MVANGESHGVEAAIGEEISYWRLEGRYQILIPLRVILYFIVGLPESFFVVCEDLPAYPCDVFFCLTY